MPIQCQLSGWRKFVALRLSPAEFFVLCLELGLLDLQLVHEVSQVICRHICDVVMCNGVLLLCLLWYFCDSR
jgi:hypothetical protein